MVSEFQSQAIIATSVFTSSFLGSVHCMGMCGPIAVITNQDLISAFFYQLGRLISYLILGAIAGLMGQAFWGGFSQGLVTVIAPLSLGTIFIYIGVLLLKNKRFHLPLPKFLNRPLGNAVLQQRKSQHSTAKYTFLIGLLSVTLPCGWVYGFVIGAAATKSIVTSLMVMFMFWLGTVPALIIGPVVLEKLLGPFKKKFPTYASFILIMLGIFLVVTGINRNL